MANQEKHLTVMVETMLVAGLQAEDMREPLPKEERLRRLSKVEEIYKQALEHWIEDHCLESANACMILRGMLAMHNWAMEQEYYSE